MSTMTTARPAQMATSRNLLCWIYGAIAVAALLLTWRNGAPYTHSPAAFLFDFWRDTKANNATRFITADILLWGIAASVWMVVEARRHQIPWVWAYIMGCFLVAASVFYPLFLIARELRTDRPDALGLRSIDAALLASLCGALLALAVWVDL